MKPKCPFCLGAVVLKTGASCYRRKEKGVTVTTQYWECPSFCVGPDGSMPFRFHDVALLKANDKGARKAWKAIFHEEMPKSPFRTQKSGRKR